MTAELARALQAVHARARFRRSDDLVFAHLEHGGVIPKANIARRFKIALRNAGIDQSLRFHDLRHTFGTHMAATGVPMRTPQEWMGHRDLTTTQRYADYAPSEREGRWWRRRLREGRRSQDRRTYRQWRRQRQGRRHPSSKGPGAGGPTRRISSAPVNDRSPDLSASTVIPIPRRGPAVPAHRGHKLVLPPRPGSPDPADLQSIRRWVQQASAPTVVDLFCGAGGLSLGLHDAGFNVLVGADSDALAVETHTANIGGLGYAGDLTDPSDFIEHLDGWGITTVDLVVGGVPCQPFSRAGESKIKALVKSGVRPREDPRAGLWQSFMQVVERLSPRAVLVENVPNLPSWDDGAVLIGFLESFRDLGYTVHAQVIDCFLFGVPQHRARLFIVATRGVGPFAWPEPLGEFTSLQDAIGDLPIVPGGQRTEALNYRPRRALTSFQQQMRADVLDSESGLVHDHITRAVRPDDLEAYGLLSEGQTYTDLPERLRRYRSDIFTDKYKRLSWKELSRTITAHLAKDGYWYIHPQQHRTLSVREAARIQTFPDSFRFAGQPSHRYRQIGNAVPPFMGRAIGNEIIRTLKAPEAADDRPDAHEAREDLLEWHTRHVRAFPWRRSGLAPWHVLMAEICLHRARAEQVLPVFEALTRIAPTPQKMVENADYALQTMRELGLRWRAETVVAVAEAIMELFGGDVPDTDLELRMLPGVGDRVAQAVLCFGSGRRAVLIDTNTMRIVSRVNGRDATRRWQLRLDLHRMAGARGPDAQFNHALLDLGALVCIATAPRCSECPLRAHCVMGSGAPVPSQLGLSEVE